MVKWVFGAWGTIALCIATGAWWTTRNSTPKKEFVTTGDAADDYLRWRSR